MTETKEKREPILADLRDSGAIAKRREAGWAEAIESRLWHDLWMAYAQNTLFAKDCLLKRYMEWRMGR